MKITFIGHSGFYAELPEAALLFDYYCGRMPVPDSPKPLFVFVSHRHPDHFSEKIFSLAERTERICYVLSDDICESLIPRDLWDRTLRVGPGERIELPGECGKGKAAIVRSFRSTDEGVAFLVDVAGARLYHAGDLNNWHWEEEGPAWNGDQSRRYSEEMRKLAACAAEDGREVDAAFVPLDSRLGDFFWMGLDEYMRTVGARRVFPMHLFGSPSVIERMRRMPCAAAYAPRILGSGAKGEEFII